MLICIPYFLSCILNNVLFFPATFLAIVSMTASLDVAVEKKASETLLLSEPVKSIFSTEGLPA